MNSNLTMEIKQEAQQSIMGSYAESFASQEDLDNESLFNASTASFSGYRNLVEVICEPEQKPKIDEKVQKEEEKPVVHRNTGKISGRRFMSSLALNSKRHYFSAPCDRKMMPVTQSLLIEPVLQQKQNNTLVSTQTSPIGKKKVF